MITCTESKVLHVMQLSNNFNETKFIENYFKVNINKPHWNRAIA